jgi:hypothetical protein
LALATYVLVAYPVTKYTEWYVRSSIGLDIPQGMLFRLAIFPVGLALSHHTA